MKSLKQKTYNRHNRMLKLLENGLFKIISYSFADKAIDFSLFIVIEKNHHTYGLKVIYEHSKRNKR